MHSPAPDASLPFPDGRDFTRIAEIIQRYDGRPEALLMILQDIGDLYHYVPPPAVGYVADALAVRQSRVYSVATFYKTISLVPRGEYIVSVCTGTACHVRGADKIMDVLKDKLGIREGQTTADGRFSLEAVRCVGCCASGPVVTVNQDTHGGLDRSAAVRLLDRYQ